MILPMPRLPRRFTRADATRQLHRKAMWVMRFAAVPCVANLLYCSVILAHPEIARRNDLPVLIGFFLGIYVATWPAAIIGAISFTAAQRSRMAVALLCLYFVTLLLDCYVAVAAVNLG
jgi:hypothetical protein